MPSACCGSVGSEPDRSEARSGTSRRRGVIDQLTYYFDDAVNPDRLTRVVDAGSATKGFVYAPPASGNHYLYDAAGNLTEDKHKKFTVAYNHLNLPRLLTFTDGSGSKIEFVYTADGAKLGQKALTNTTINSEKNYVNGIEYNGANTEAIYHSEGRLTPNGATAWFYEYSLRDHLGNARVNFRANGAAPQFLDEHHYYPFGMEMEGFAGGGSPYRYNNKEITADFGVNWYFYGARWYDAAVGRWWSVDPLADKYNKWSPYNYGFNNPVLFVDPDGRGAVVSKMKDDKGVTYLQVSATVYIYGNAASPDVAAALTKSVNAAWNATTTTKDGKETTTGSKDANNVAVVFDIQFKYASDDEVSLLAENNSDASVNFLAVYSAEENEYNGSAFEGNSGILDVGQNEARGGTVAPHEIGHMLGFRSSEADNTHSSKPTSDGTLPMMFNNIGGVENKDAMLSKRRVTPSDIAGLRLSENLIGYRQKQTKTIGESNNNLIIKNVNERKSFIDNLNRN